MSRDLTFTVAGFDGDDQHLAYAPPDEAAHEIAKQMLADEWKGSDPTTARLFIVYHGIRYRIMDHDGKVERAGLSNT